jgi:hypothetical protein
VSKGDFSITESFHTGGVDKETVVQLQNVCTDGVDNKTDTHYWNVCTQMMLTTKLILS